ncbi:MAG: NADH-quinone oxidoreductase subunit N [Chloroflexi bacterium]|nr:NADH-quinone oxidoreductase subunit N [Chloroflexota bacterium]
MSISIPDINLRIIAPVLIVAITSILVLVAELFTRAEQKRTLGYLSIVGLIFASFAAFTLWGSNASAFRGMISADNFGLFLTLTILIGAALSVLLAMDFARAQNIEQGEYYVLLLAAVAGMILMATATDLIVIFLGLELLSLPLYILAAFQRNNSYSLEAGVKYFLLGAFSSAFFLYGIALIYGATGTTNLLQISQSLSLSSNSQSLTHSLSSNSLAFIGAGLLLVGFAFKVALVPFHWWTPDVYDGAPTPVTAFMSVAVKAAAFGAFIRVFVFAIPPQAIEWRTILAVIAVLTMTLGNIAALLQSNIKRMLAYSSIAHAGYILIALVVGETATASSLYYILAYTFTNLGAFGAVIALADGERERLKISDFAGVARDHPRVAAALAICLLSLAGFPPFAGFIGKFLIFGSAVENGWTWLAVVGVLNSVVSMYYYARPIVEMYMHDGSADWERGVKIAPLVGIALLIAVIGVIALGIFPSGAIAWAQSAFVR